MNINYYVRTTGEREFDYRPLQYTLLIDKEHKPVASFIAQLKAISNADSVLLEDDLYLCENFQQRLEEIVAQYPNYIINFFYRPFDYFSTHVTDQFSWNQCTYYPKGVALVVANKMQQILNERKLTRIQYDALEDIALRELHIPNVVVRPCLVQHRDLVSLIGNGGRRSTIYYADYLTQANIKYEDAFALENMKKLIEIRDKHLGGIKNE